MAQKLTGWDGNGLTESDIVTYLAGEGGAWTSWTPTVTQSGSVTVTNTRSRYARYGRTIHFTLNLAVTGSGTGSNDVSVSLPATAASSGELIGTGYIYDSSAVAGYKGISYLASTTAVKILPNNNNGAGAMGNSEFTAGLASGDQIVINGTYEAAS
jgi:hypothetical protein